MCWPCWCGYRNSRYWVNRVPMCWFDVDAGTWEAGTRCWGTATARCKWLYACVLTWRWCRYRSSRYLLLGNHNGKVSVTVVSVCWPCWCGYRSSRYLLLGNHNGKVSVTVCLCADLALMWAQEQPVPAVGEPQRQGVGVGSEGTGPPQPPLSLPSAGPHHQLPSSPGCHQWLQVRMVSCFWSCLSRNLAGLEISLSVDFNTQRS